MDLIRIRFPTFLVKIPGRRASFHDPFFIPDPRAVTIARCPEKVRKRQHQILMIYHALTGSLIKRTRTVFLTALILLVTILSAGCTNTGTPPAGQPGVTTAVTPLPAKTPASPEAMVAFVEKAYEYAKMHGKEAALAEFNNRGGRFIDGELYIFTYDLQANTLALPFQPDLTGKNRWNLTDASGNRPTRENILAARSGGNFVHYSYLDPADNNTVKPKPSYSMLAGSE